MKILFVCKYNAFRSRVSEEYFKKINKNEKISAISRGFIAGSNSDKIQQRLAKEILGADIAKRKPLPITIQDLISSDMIVVAANDIPKIMFNYSPLPIWKKVTIWNIKDEQERNPKNIKKIILKIKKKVDDLNGKLENK